MRKLNTGLVSLALAASCCMGGVEKTLNQTGNFNVGGNWTPNGVPGAGDRIKIPAGRTCTVTADATVDTMEVLGTLEIDPNITLTLENDDHIIHVCNPPAPSCALSDNSIVDGDVKLVLHDNEVDGGNLKFVNEDHIVAGDGNITGRTTTGSEIQIAGDIVLKNQLDQTGEGIRGALTINGLSGTVDGKLINQGVVRADGVLIVDAVIDDIDDARWMSGCKDTLEFKQGSTDLEGDFTNDVMDDDIGEPGKFTFHEDVKTCGAYERACGWIDVDESNSVTFEYVDFVDLTDGAFGCGNPGTAAGSPATCEDPFVVGTDVSGDTCE